MNLRSVNDAFKMRTLQFSIQFNSINVMTYDIRTMSYIIYPHLLWWSINQLLYFLTYLLTINQLFFSKFEFRDIHVENLISSIIYDFPNISPSPPQSIPLVPPPPSFYVSVQIPFSPRHQPSHSLRPPYVSPHAAPQHICSELLRIS